MMFLQSHTFEQYVYLCQSCMEFYMLYLAHFLRTVPKRNMTKESFYKALLNAETGYFSCKAIRVKGYFETNIFSCDNEIDTIITFKLGNSDKTVTRQNCSPG